MVTMSCDDTVARLATAAMLGIEAEAATPAEIRDAIGEIANLMGGQTKMVLGPGSSLGLPLVIEGDGYESMVPHSYTVGTVHCECAGHLVDLTIASADRRSIAR
jgi:CheY-specific phosphatase CheX